MEQLLISLIQLAIDKKASDIHFIQEKNHLQIQLRTMRGIIPLYQDLWDTGFFEFLKFHAGFDLTNPYLPQSGQFEIKIQQRRIYCRFSVIVNQTIQTGVLRMLNTREDLSIEDLINAFLEYRKRLDKEKPLETKITRKELSVKERISHIRSLLKTKRKLEFTELFESFTKEYVVVTFLSILNMSKNNEITLFQKDNFSPIMIESRL